MSKIESLKEIIKERNDPYLNYHATRFEDLVKFVDVNYSDGKKILDIGNSPFAEILFKIFGSKVDELGFHKDSTKSFGHQYHFDLNNSYDKALLRTDLGPYDIIIFAEVIEHLYTSPSYVLSYLFSLLKEGGKLILQTPNGVVFHKRIQLLLGKNPYMLIKENRLNPGHFREYTKNELVTYAKDCGFKLDKAYFGNYFNYQYTFTEGGLNKNNKYLKVVNFFYSILPSSLKPGITMVLSK